MTLDSVANSQLTQLLTRSAVTYETIKCKTVSSCPCVFIPQWSPSNLAFVRLGDTLGCFHSVI